MVEEMADTRREVKVASWRDHPSELSSGQKAQAERCPG